jgi:ribosomal protein S1
MDEEAALDRAEQEAMEGVTAADLAAAALSAPTAEPAGEAILKGRIANIGSQDVLIDVGGKSLGAMPLAEFGKDEKYAVGDDIEVALVGGEEMPGGFAGCAPQARQSSAA